MTQQAADIIDGGYINGDTLQTIDRLITDAFIYGAPGASDSEYRQTVWNSDQRAVIASIGNFIRELYHMLEKHKDEQDIKLEAAETEKLYSLISIYDNVDTLDVLEQILINTISFTDATVDKTELDTLYFQYRCIKTILKGFKNWGYA